MARWTEVQRCRYDVAFCPQPTDCLTFFRPKAAALLSGLADKLRQLGDKYGWELSNPFSLKPLPGASTLPAPAMPPSRLPCPIRLRVFSFFASFFFTSTQWN
ncbi:hypothetical protein TcWFU_006108 [Taenia crassiceps]|uniref:Uncharacterized protein n=1 Tax=Taenia crassiceps TaxID=6207 RepID=A0ABR4QBH8_9CEST